MILIGPIDGARHCDPEPDYLQVRSLQVKIFAQKLQSHEDWELLNSFSLKEEDQISVYRRKLFLS